MEEAPSLGRPVLILREITGRPELVAAGGAWLAGPDAEEVARKAAAILGDTELPARLSDRPNPFGDGRAGVRIARAILERLRG